MAVPNGRPKNPNDVGAGWKRDSKSGGSSFISLRLSIADKKLDLSNIYLSVFENNRKRPGTKDPDYVVLLSSFGSNTDTSKAAAPATEKQTPPVTPKAPAAPVSKSKEPF